MFIFVCIINKKAVVFSFYRCNHKSNANCRSTHYFECMLFYKHIHVFVYTQLVTWLKSFWIKIFFVLINICILNTTLSFCQILTYSLIYAPLVIHFYHWKGYGLCNIHFHWSIDTDIRWKGWNPIFDNNATIKWLELSSIIYPNDSL